jgi:hypothetical protein
MGKVMRCDRCRKRHRGQPNWNTDYIAGIVIGYICPDCQTAQEHIGAEVNQALSPPEQHRAIKLSTEDDSVRFVYQLIETYPIPEIMRRKADRLAAARPDLSGVVRLMRRIADDMESGELYDDGAA